MLQELIKATLAHPAGMIEYSLGVLAALTITRGLDDELTRDYSMWLREETGY